MEQGLPQHSATVFKLQTGKPSAVTERGSLPEIKKKFWTLPIFRHSPIMIVLLECKSIKGLVDTGTDATIISLHDAKAFPHWKLKDGPTITWIKEDSTSKTRTNLVNWKDLDGNQGHFCPIVSGTFFGVC